MSYALKFSDFGMDGADRWGKAYDLSNNLIKFAQDSENDPWRENAATAVWFALGEYKTSGQ